MDKSIKELSRRQKTVEEELIKWVKAEVEYRKDKRNNPKPLSKSDRTGFHPVVTAYQNKLKLAISEIQDKKLRDIVEKILKEKSLI